MQWFTKHYGREQILDNYIKVVDITETADDKPAGENKLEEKKQNRWQERAKIMLQKDNQLRETITLINMLHTAQNNTPNKVQNRQLAVTYLKQSHISGDKLKIEEIKL